MKKSMIVLFMAIVGTIILLSGCGSLKYALDDKETKAAYKEGRADGEAVKKIVDKQLAYKDGFADGAGINSNSFYIGGAVRSGGNYGAFNYNSNPYMQRPFFYNPPVGCGFRQRCW